MLLRFVTLVPLVVLLADVRWVDTMNPFPMEDACQPKDDTQAPNPEALQTACDKCCAEQKEVTQVETAITTTCTKYHSGNYSASAKTCWCISDFIKRCHVNVCQPAVHYRNGSLVTSISDETMTKIRHGCSSCCKAMSVPNIGILLDHPTVFRKGHFSLVDLKCRCQWSADF